MLKQQHVPRVPREVLSEITIETLASFNGLFQGKRKQWSLSQKPRVLCFFQLSPAGTDTGLNFFYPGKTEEGAKLFVTGIACLSYGLAQYNESWLETSRQDCGHLSECCWYNEGMMKNHAGN